MEKRNCSKEKSVISKEFPWKNGIVPRNIHVGTIPGSGAAKVMQGEHEIQGMGIRAIQNYGLEEKDMKEKVTDEMAYNMQADREAGMTIVAIAEKYGVSTTAARAYTYASDEVASSRRSWPEWKEWDELHRRYGTKKGKKARH